MYAYVIRQGHNSFFIRFNAVSETFDSIQLMTHNGFTRNHSNQLTTQNGFLKFDSNRLTTQRASSIFIRINTWLNSQFHMSFSGHSTLLLNWYDLFWAFHSSVDFVWPLLGAFDSSAFRQMVWISTWLKQYVGDLNRFNSWLKRFSMNWFRINSWLKWIPRYCFKSTRESKRCPIFRFKLTHDSSEKHLILNPLMIRLWVIPVSVKHTPNVVTIGLSIPELYSLTANFYTPSLCTCHVPQWLPSNKASHAILCRVVHRDSISFPRIHQDVWWRAEANTNNTDSTIDWCFCLWHQRLTVGRIRWSSLS